MQENSSQHFLSVSLRKLRSPCSAQGTAEQTTCQPSCLLKVKTSALRPNKILKFTSDFADRYYVNLV